ncbi:carbohydrate porin [Gluconobacter kanchanaburiensis]|uniref:carbohydrate porin n=1 Tax=Gluconobacter kanchanaburiensis TaxID=563199 RepID=UPI0011BF4057|nr:carbohydrate porin [Gluconobacter kanchanaburiensis]MBF0861559.1 carbohydrate porin [Gluconobacter kanchanaburiensis]
MISGSVRYSAALLIGSAALFCGSAYAQTIQEAEPTYDASVRVAKPLPATPLNGPVVPPFENPPALLPDVFGVKAWLRAHGIALLMSNTNEFTGAVSKPTPGFRNYRQGASNAGQISTILHMNWDKLIGLRGFATHTVFTSRYGTTANRMFGDWLGHASEIYGGGGNVVVHLVMAYGEENLFGGRLAIAGGRMTELADFSNSPLFCNFINNSLCGRPRAVSDNDYIGRYPAGVWGTRIRGRPSRYTYIQAAVYFPEKSMFSNLYNRSGFKFSGGSAVLGQSIPVEVGWEPQFGAKHKLAGHYKIGARLLTVPVSDNYYDVNGLPLSVTRKKAMQHNRSWSAWFETDQKIWQPQGAPASSGTTLIGGFILNDPRIALRRWETYFGFINRGFIRSRPQDALNFIGMYEKIAGGVSATEANYLEEGAVSLMPNHATGVQKNAAVFEVNYQIQVTRGFAFAPDYQIFFNPNGQRNLRTAHVLGFKSTVQIF